MQDIVIESTKTRLIIRNTIYLIIFWMLAVLLYKVIRIYGVEAVIEAGMHEGKIGTHTLHVVLGGVVVGILFGLLDWILSRMDLGKKSTVQILLVKLVSFFGALFLGIITARVAGLRLTEGVSLHFAINDLPRFLSSPLVIPLYIYAIVASFGITFIRQVEKKFGSKVLLNLAVGKYFKAREAELAEAKEYLEFQVQERTADLQHEISQRVETENELRQAMEKAKAASIAKSQFLANMSHEIRTPLNAIIGFAQILESQAGNYNLKRDFIKHLNSIKLSGEHLSDLINDILDLSKIEAGKMALSKEDMNLKQLVQSVFHINKVTAKQKGLKFSYDFGSELPTYIHSDRSKIKQILMNLLSNAIKFSKPGSEVFLTAMLEDGRIILEVKDEGIGIPADKINLIFDPFVQADNSTTREFGGTGLGLAISKKMVELLDGAIIVDSMPGDGATFKVLIPYQGTLYRDKFETQTDLSHISIPEKSRVLVVEDNPMNQEMVKAFFHEINHDILVASNGLEGVRMAKGYLPDLILMDIHMPEMDGIEAMREIKKEQPELPIIAMSADAFQEQQAEALEMGFDDYITKPIQFRKLVNCMKKYLNSRNLIQRASTSELSSVENDRVEQLILEIEGLQIYETEKLVQTIEALSLFTPRVWTSQALDAAFEGNPQKLNGLLTDLRQDR